MYCCYEKRIWDESSAIHLSIWHNCSSPNYKTIFKDLAVDSVNYSVCLGLFRRRNNFTSITNNCSFWGCYYSNLVRTPSHWLCVLSPIYSQLRQTPREGFYLLFQLFLFRNRLKNSLLVFVVDNFNWCIFFPFLVGAGSAIRRLYWLFYWVTHFTTKQQFSCFTGIDPVYFNLAKKWTEIKMNLSEK